MTQRSYFAATRHPWPCLLFLVPFLALYEVGVVWLNTAHPEALRNGADAWLRLSLEAIGLRDVFWVPVILLVILALWCLVHPDERSDDLIGTWAGMALESVLAALGLWCLSRGLGPLLDSIGVELALPNTGGDQVLEQVVTYVGAGIYEEVLFRLGLFAGLRWLLRAVEVPGPLATLSAAVVAAVLFSAAHHLGSTGEPFNNYVFLFRTLAGLYFTAIFQWRGFGIAVGGHACYDVLVGVALV